MAKIPVEERKLNEEQKKAVTFGEGHSSKTSRCHCHEENDTSLWIYRSEPNAGTSYIHSSIRLRQLISGEVELGENKKDIQ